MGERGDYVILDNGAAEDLVYGAKHLHHLASQFHPNEIVVQDVIGDPHDTLALAQGFARYAQSDYRYMFVLQGKTMDEVLQCLRVIDNSVWAVYITTLGIPRHFGTTIDAHFRVNLLEFLIEEQFHLRYDLHFLGAQPWTREVILLAEQAAGLDGVRGIDTSFPIYMGLEGRDINRNEYMARPDNYFDATRGNIVAEQNIETYLSWAMYD